ncbi:hypothetical protein EVAR_51574_1 [Eumeta japonica]|uniref:Uncharacterized protein n=1 Tax=Eumeta variegata TaxID=151549 RepID=A0A4C1Z8U8_EUMVA|nr:hypothetical protein EVAR_51574_1 [Eumeta japonica]
MQGPRVLKIWPLENSRFHIDFSNNFKRVPGTLIARAGPRKNDKRAGITHATRALHYSFRPPNFEFVVGSCRSRAGVRLHFKKLRHPAFRAPERAALLSELQECYANFISPNLLVQSDYIIGYGESASLLAYPTGIACGGLGAWPELYNFIGG